MFRSLRGILDWLANPISADAARWLAAVPVALVLVAVYEHLRRKETPPAVGLLLAALGLFLWAVLRGPGYYMILIAGVSTLIPWLIWGGRPRQARSAIAARSPFTISIRRREGAAVTPQGDRGVLDFERDGVAATEAMVRVLGQMARSMKVHTRRLKRHTRRLERARNRQPSAQRKYRLSEKTARDIEAHAADMEKLEERLRAEGEAVIANFTAWLGSQTTGAQTESFRNTFRESGRVSGETRKATEEYRGSTKELRAENISRPVNRATDRLVVVLTKVIEDIRAMERFSRTQGRRPRAAPRRG